MTLQRNLGFMKECLWWSFYEDCADEIDGALSFRWSLPLSSPEWVAIVDKSTFRRIR
jgi:hypothetical protein